MSNYDQERGSTAWSLLNPFTQYTSIPWNIPTLWTAARSGSIGFNPLWFTLGLNRKMAFTKNMIKAGGWRKIVGYGIEGYDFGGVGSVADMWPGEGGISSLARPGLVKKLSAVMRRTPLEAGDIPIAESIGNVLGHIGYEGKVFYPGPAMVNRPATAIAESAVSKAVSVFKTSQLVSRLAMGISPMLIGLQLGDLAANGAAMAFKGMIAVSKVIDAQTQNMRNLEFGEGLGAGFRTQQAATERQRLVQELQRTPLSGRRFLGREANLYSGMI